MYYSHLTPQETKKMKCRKLCLWHTATSRPIFTHNQLEPIMTSIHFSPIVPGPASTDSLTGTVSVQWREYRFIGKPEKDWNLKSKKRSWPRLPYPRVDGLHLKSYLAFLGALEYFIDPLVVGNMFYIRPTAIGSRGDIIHKTVFREIKNLDLDKFSCGTGEELEYMTTLVLYFYREDTLDDATEETYCQLKASVGNDISKYVRKDGTRKIEEDEKDDSSDFICLIDQGDALCGDGYHGELSRDAWENTEACCSSSGDYLRDLIRCKGDAVYRSERKVVKKIPELVDIYKELLESLQREDL